MNQETEGDYKETKTDNSIGKIWKEEGKKLKFSKHKKKRERQKVERDVYDERKRDVQCEREKERKESEIETK